MTQPRSSGPRRRANPLERVRDRVHALERASQQKRLGKLHLELVLERQHEIHAGVRSQARLVEIGVVAQRLGAEGKLAVLANDVANAIAHAWRCGGRKGSSGSPETVVNTTSRATDG